MDIEHGYNFNDPVEVTSIFRVPNPSDEEFKEFAGKFSFTWEDIKTLEEYPYTDDWKQYKGPKYWVNLHQDAQSRLILGDYQTISTYWRMFRNKYPMFEED